MTCALQTGSDPLLSHGAKAMTTPSLLFPLLNNKSSLRLFEVIRRRTAALKLLANCSATCTPNQWQIFMQIEPTNGEHGWPPLLTGGKAGGWQLATGWL